MTKNRWTLVAVGLATFMTYLDNNIVNVAIPDIQRELGLSTAGIEWVVSGYILTFAGLLTQHVSWEWICWINVPVGLVTMARGAWAITESREEEARGLDLGGLVLSTASLFALTWALIEGHDRGWTSAGILGAFGAAAA